MFRGWSIDTQGEEAIRAGLAWPKEEMAFGTPYASLQLPDGRLKRWQRQVQRQTSCRWTVTGWQQGQGGTWEFLMI